MLQGIRYDLTVTSLVRSGRPNEESIEALRAQVAERQAVLAERAAGIAHVQSDLETFRLRYRQEVGLLHEELDDLERAIAEAELGEISKLVDNRERDTTTSPAGAQPDPVPRFTSDAVRKLFRDVAKTIHPDLASDDKTRDRRHSLMAEANRAYALGDEERLRRILETWESSPESVQGSDPKAERERLVRRIAQIEEQLSAYASELTALQASALWQLKAMVDDASARGKDLVADMVRRLKRDIMAARNRLDAMRWSP